MRPTGQLRPYVSSYVSFDMAGWPAGRHRGMPVGSLSLVVCFGDPVVVRCAGRAEVVAVATVGGLRTDPVDIVHDGTQRGVQLELTPRGARALLGVPAGALAHDVFPLEDVVGRRAGELADRLAGAVGQSERAEVLDSVFTSWLKEHSYSAPVEAMWRRLVASAGTALVSAIAADIGLGRRHLGELARAELGLTPKQVARVLRFAHARSRIASGQTPELAEVAVACGYFDQAHLTNEWKRFAGCTPSQWRSEELPFLQDRNADRG
jgi:AraC-like DNA-binding protein